jgi:amino acid transporter
MVWGFVGAIGTTLTIFILPPAFYLRVRAHPPRPDLKQVAAWGLMLVGVLVLLVCTYQSVMNVVQPIPKILPPKLINGTRFLHHS